MSKVIQGKSKATLELLTKVRKCKGKGIRGLNRLSHKQLTGLLGTLKGK